MLRRVFSLRDKTLCIPLWKVSVEYFIVMTRKAQRAVGNAGRAGCSSHSLVNFFFQQAGQVLAVAFFNSQQTQKNARVLCMDQLCDWLLQ